MGFQQYGLIRAYYSSPLVPQKLVINYSGRQYSNRMYTVEVQLYQFGGYFSIDSSDAHYEVCNVQGVTATPTVTYGRGGINPMGPNQVLISATYGSVLLRVPYC